MSSRPANRAQAGFTLVELILVIVLMGLLAGIALPRLTEQKSLDELTTKDEVKAMLRLARSKAISQNQSVCFVWTAAQFYLVYAPTSNCSTTNPPLTFAMSDDGVQFQLRPGITLSSSTSTSIQFNSRGQLMPLGTGNQQITVGSLPALTISRETGFVY